MSVEFTLDAELRDDLGKGASRRLRRTGKVPAVLYGGGKDAVALTLDHDTLVHSLENEAFYSHVLTVRLGGAEEKAVLKDLQRHPAKPVILHLDLQRISEDQDVRMHVPLHFVGEDIAPGVKQQGGAVSHLLSDVEITCLPRHLPEYIEVDVSQMEINQSIHLSDLELPEGVSLVGLVGAGQDHSVVTIHAAHAAPEEEEGVEEEGPAEPEE